MAWKQILHAHVYGPPWVKAKVIRFQGAWAKRSDSISDTYLREAQVIVLKGQVVVLERLRSGEKIGSLEGVGLTGERFGAEGSKQEDGDEGLKVHLKIGPRKPWIRPRQSF